MCVFIVMCISGDINGQAVFAYRLSCLPKYTLRTLISRVFAYQVSDVTNITEDSLVCSTQVILLLLLVPHNAPTDL